VDSELCESQQAALGVSFGVQDTLAGVIKVLSAYWEAKNASVDIGLRRAEFHLIRMTMECEGRAMATLVVFGLLHTVYACLDAGKT
jgi:hypothetical protein